MKDRFELKKMSHMADAIAGVVSPVLAIASSEQDSVLRGGLAALIVVSGESPGLLAAGVRRQKAGSKRVGLC